MSTILGLLLLVLAIAVLVYWVKSLIIMKNETLFLILGILFSPIIQALYFFTKRDLMDDEQATTMKRFLLVCIAYIVVLVLFMFSAAAQMPVQ
ncbi:hypothetical protein [Alysiella crassa]|uniref:Uncharacterized protein n=1 Tax=Alysiella crassa TaxID=153491 RepID=A0A376BVA3_9NEIS|nr:hypothetical protein [Alysiella crassa]UOP06366.1 hypothetical protein LVJ80_11310 [Alysiella crassa]SSY80876.1 Uncharacterised protein [Alysiella crassa]